MVNIFASLVYNRYQKIVYTTIYKYSTTRIYMQAARHVINHHNYKPCILLRAIVREYIIHYYSTQLYSVNVLIHTNQYTYEMLYTFTSQHMLLISLVKHYPSQAY